MINRRTILTIIIASCSAGHAQAQPITEQRLIDLYSQQRAKVKGYYAEYSVKQVILIKDSKVWGDVPTDDPLVEDYVLAMRGKSFYSKVVNKQKIRSRAPYTQKAFVYDGVSFLQVPPDAATKHDPKWKGEYVKRPPEKAGLNIPTWYQPRVAFDAPKFTPQPRTVAELLEAGKAKLEQQSATVDGATCVVATVTETGQRYFLDPKLGYALRRIVVERDGILASTITCGDFVQVVAGVWMPRRIESRPVPDPKGVPAEYAGKSIYGYEVVVTKLQANGTGLDKLLTAKIPAGSKVLDITVPPLQADGTPRPQEDATVTPYVHYVQPADGKDIDAAVRDGQLSTGAWFAQKDAERTRPRWWYVGVACLAGFAATLAVVKYRRRSTGS